MPRYAVLLRGVNLGGTRRVPMGELRAVLERAGFENVRTLLASGNVVLGSDRDAATLGRELPPLLRDAFGIEIPVVLRSRAELADVVARNPFADVADDPKRLQISFLSATPDAAAAAELEAADVAPERVAVSGREIYAWHPSGVGRSPLAALIDDRRLGVELTARNLNTVTKLLELADA